MNAILNFMKANYKIILLIVAISATLWSFMPKKQGGDPEKDKILLEIISDVIKLGHYDPVAMDDKFSQRVYKDYLDALDPSKRFFVESDIAEFKVYENQIDDLINERDLSFFDLTYERLQKRMQEAKVVYKALNDKPYDFSTDESINLDSDKNAFA